MQVIHRSPGNSPHKGQWQWALMFSLICTWTKGWVNNRDASDLRHHHTHYDITIMCVVFGPNIKWIYHIGVELQPGMACEIGTDTEIDIWRDEQTDRTDRHTDKQTHTQTRQLYCCFLQLNESHQTSGTTIFHNYLKHQCQKYLACIQNVKSPAFTNQPMISPNISIYSTGLIQVCHKTKLH